MDDCKNKYILKDDLMIEKILIGFSFLFVMLGVWLVISVDHNKAATVCYDTDGIEVYYKTKHKTGDSGVKRLVGDLHIIEETTEKFRGECHFSWG